MKCPLCGGTMKKDNGVYTCRKCGIRRMGEKRFREFVEEMEKI